MITWKTWKFIQVRSFYHKKQQNKQISDVIFWTQINRRFSKIPKLIQSLVFDNL